MGSSNFSTMINQEHLWPENAGKTLEQLRANMQPLNHFMKKRIVREGDMNYECYPHGIKLQMRFCGYFDDDRRDLGTQWEMDFQTGEHHHPGFYRCFNEALTSMRPMEIAEFSIDREVLHAQLHNDPRNPQNDGIFSLEVLHVENMHMVPLRQPQAPVQLLESAQDLSQCQCQAQAQTQTQAETQSQSQFMGAYNKAEIVRRRAEDALNGNKFQQSVELCEEANMLLRQFKTENEEEQAKRFNMLVTISNLLLECYEKRALVHEGKQHEDLGELEQARETFLEALRVNPTTITIHELIASIDAKILAEVQAGKEREAKEEAARKAAAKERAAKKKAAKEAELKKEDDVVFLPGPESPTNGSEESIGSGNPQQR